MFFLYAIIAAFFKYWRNEENKINKLFKYHIGKKK